MRRVQLLASDLLRRHVRHCPERTAGTGQVLFIAVSLSACQPLRCCSKNWR